MKTNNKISAIALALMAAFCSAIQAQTLPTSISVPYTSPLDHRIKYYAYTPDVVYTLHVTVGMHTHIQLGADEKLVEIPTIGETVQWRISGNGQNLYVKALQPNTSTSLTLITSKRVYQFELQATEDKNKRIQKAYFTYPDDEQKFNLDLAVQNQRRVAETNRVEAVKVGRATDPSQLNFNYKVEGAATFKPNAIYDDGVFTYFRLSNSQDLPAIFMLEEGSRNKLTPVNYVVKGDQVIVERLARNFVMKLGKDELRITQGK